MQARRRDRLRAGRADLNEHGGLAAPSGDVLKLFRFDEGFGSVAPVASRFASPTENRTRQRQEHTTKSQRLRGVEVDVYTSARRTAVDDANVLRLAIEITQKFRGLNPEVLPAAQ